MASIFLCDKITNNCHRDLCPVRTCLMLSVKTSPSYPNNFKSFCQEKMVFRRRFCLHLLLLLLLLLIDLVESKTFLCVYVSASKNLISCHFDHRLKQFLRKRSHSRKTEKKNLLNSIWSFSRSSIFLSIPGFFSFWVLFCLKSSIRFQHKT